MAEFDFEKAKEKDNKNPGVDLLQRVLSAGGLTMEMVRVAGEYAYKHDDYEQKLSKRKEELMNHLKLKSLEEFSTEMAKPHISEAITRLREAAVIAAAGYPETDPIWDLYHMNVRFSPSEFRDLANKLHQKLYHSTPEDKERGFEYMAAAGFIIAAIVYQSSPDLEAVYAAEVKREAIYARMGVATKAMEASFLDLHKAIKLAQMLEDRGVTFDEQGDPVYSEAYHQITKKGK